MKTEEAGPGGREGAANTPEDLLLLQASSELPGSLWEKGNEPLPTAASPALVLSSRVSGLTMGAPRGKDVKTPPFKSAKQRTQKVSAFYFP